MKRADDNATRAEPFWEHVRGQGRMAAFHARQLHGDTTALGALLEAGRQGRDVDALVKKAIVDAQKALFFLTRIEHARLVRSYYDVDNLRLAKRRRGVRS